MGSVWGIFLGGGLVLQPHLYHRELPWRDSKWRFGCVDIWLLRGYSLARVRFRSTESGCSGARTFDNLFRARIESQVDEG